MRDNEQALVQGCPFMKKSRTTLILGIGSTLYSDAAIGRYVIDRLQTPEILRSAAVAYTSVSMRYFEGYDRVLLVAPSESIRSVRRYVGLIAGFFQQVSPLIANIQWSNNILVTGWIIPAHDVSLGIGFSDYSRRFAEEVVADIKRTILSPDGNERLLSR